MAVDKFLTIDRVDADMRQPVMSADHNFPFVFDQIVPDHMAARLVEITFARAGGAP